MRVLVGGVLGAVAVAVVWMVIEHNTSQEFGWMAVAVGLVTGLAVHWAAGAGSRGSYGRGALAVALALIACVGSRQVYAKVMLKANAGPVIAVVAAPTETGGNEAERPSLDQAAEPAKLFLESEERATPIGSGFGNVAAGEGFSEWDTLWLTLAALTAYVVGKGRDPVVVCEAAEETPGPTEGETT